MTGPSYPDALAVGAMVAYCGWDPTVLVTNKTVLIDGNGTYLAYLPSLYVTAVTAVVVTNGDGSIFTSVVSGSLADISWGVNGVLTWESPNNGGAWPSGQQNIAVTYSGGYDGPPDDLLAALMSVTARSRTGAVAQRVGTASINYDPVIAQGDFLLIEKMVFDAYRIPKVA